MAIAPVPQLNLADAIGGLADPIIAALQQREAARLRGEQLDVALQSQQPSKAAILSGIGQPDAPPPAPQAFDPKSVPSFVSEAALGNGVDPSYLGRTIGIESKGDPNAFNRGSKAAGLMQFIPSTWKQYGGDADPFDPKANVAAGAKFAADNLNGLEQALGRPATQGELYLAHQQGLGGALKLLANPDARAADIVGMKAVTANGGTQDMTAAQFASLWTRKFPATPARASQGGAQVASADPSFVPGASAPTPPSRPAEFLVAQAQNKAGQSTAAPSGDPATASDFVPGTVALPGAQPRFGASATPPAAAAANSVQNLSPAYIANLRARLANPATQAAASAEVMALTQPPKWEVKEHDGHLYRENNRGEIQYVGQAKPDQWDLSTGADGNQYWTNKQTRAMIRANEGGGYTDVTSPQDRQAAGVPADYAGVVQRGPKNQVVMPGQEAVAARIAAAGQQAATSELGKGRSQDILEMSRSYGPAVQMREQLGGIRQALENPSVPDSAFGSFGPANLTVGKALQGVGNLLGIDPGPDANRSIADREMFEKYSTLMAGQMAKTVGGARVTNFEMQNFLRSNPGLLMSREGNTRLVGIMQQMADRSIALSQIADNVDQNDPAAYKTLMAQVRKYDAQNPIKDPMTGKALGSNTIVDPEGNRAYFQEQQNQKGQAKPLPEGYTPEKALSEARDAIARGAPRGTVLKRLRDSGIDPSALGAQTAPGR